VQAVAFVADHVKVVEKFAVTLDGEADNVTTGAGVSVAVAVAIAEPPAPEQLNVKVVVALSAALVSLPEVALVPVQPPEAVQDVALVLLHVNVTVWPAVIAVGLRFNVTVGDGLLGVDGLPPFPPPPPQPASMATPARAVNKRVERRKSCGIC
jgi:hypothetical protein